MGKQNPKNSYAVAQYHDYVMGKRFDVTRKAVEEAYANGDVQSDVLLTDEEVELLRQQQSNYTVDSVKFWTGHGYEHNWIKARKIRYKGEDIRVFPDEFNELSPDKMRLFVLGDDETGETASHHLVPDSVAGEREIERALRGDGRTYYDAALVDGCDHNQAMAVALGMDITIVDAEFPAIGWYRCRREYALVFAYEWEIEE